MKTRRVIICGGGTGGHLYPALVVGRKLREKDPALEIVHIGSHRAVEKKIMAEQGVRFIPMKIEGLVGRGAKSLKALVLLPIAFLKTAALLVRLRPALVIGVGGFSSGPVILLASWFRRPTIILEQNVRPGFTNRLLTRWADKAVTAFESSRPYFRGKGIWLGNPVREAFSSMAPKAPGERFTVLVFGGSQGSHFLNGVVTAALPLLKDRRDRLAFIHQTGESDFETVRAAYAENGFGTVDVAPYYMEMAEAFRKADYVVCRAGATTCAELIASSRPALLVPFAGAAENHQELNARELEKTGGADVVLEKDFTAAEFAARIARLCGSRDILGRMREGLAALRTEGTADRIADVCFRMMAGGK